MTSVLEQQNFDWTKYVRECLDSTEYLCLGTTDGRDNIWTNPVWFAYDEKFNLYFVSKLNSIHMPNISKHQFKISVSIFSTNQNIKNMLKKMDICTGCKYKLLLKY